MNSPKPPVDQATAAAFQRPGQVNGSFAPRGQRPPKPIGRTTVVPEMLVDAFGRPDPATPGLTRPDPGPVVDELPHEPDDPWRDPESGVTLGAPAQNRPEPQRTKGPPLQRFTLRQALFEHRLRPSALIGLAVGALVVGAVGGLIVMLLGRTVPIAAGNPDYTLSAVDPAVEREPGSVAAIAAKVVPAVVSLEVRTGDTGDTGSGVVIDPQGHILTNNHVISRAATDKDAVLTVVFSDGTRVPGTIVGRDPQSDLAVVRVATTDNMTVAQIGNSDTLAVGDTVIAIGSPLGLQGTVTTGIVSAKHRPVRLSGEGTDTNAVIDAV
jgi:putative serine protease PepD